MEDFSKFDNILDEIGEEGPKFLSGEYDEGQSAPDIGDDFADFDDDLDLDLDIGFDDDKPSAPLETSAPKDANVSEEAGIADLLFKDLDTPGSKERRKEMEDQWKQEKSEMEALSQEAEDENYETDDEDYATKKIPPPKTLPPTVKSDDDARKKITDDISELLNMASDMGLPGDNIVDTEGERPPFDPDNIPDIEPVDVNLGNALSKDTDEGTPSDTLSMDDLSDLDDLGLGDIEDTSPTPDSGTPSDTLSMDDLSDLDDLGLGDIEDTSPTPDEGTPSDTLSMDDLSDLDDLGLGDIEDTSPTPDEGTPSDTLSMDELSDLDDLGLGDIEDTSPTPDKGTPSDTLSMDELSDLDDLGLGDIEDTSPTPDKGTPSDTLSMDDLSDLDDLGLGDIEDTSPTPDEGTPSDTDDLGLDDFDLGLDDTTSSFAAEEGTSDELSDVSLDDLKPDAGLGDLSSILDDSSLKSSDEDDLADLGLDDIGVPVEDTSSKPADLDESTPEDEDLSFSSLDDMIGSEEDGLDLGNLDEGFDDTKPDETPPGDLDIESIPSLSLDDDTLSLEKESDLGFDNTDLDASLPSDSPVAGKASDEFGLDSLGDDLSFSSDDKAAPKDASSDFGDLDFSDEDFSFDDDKSPAMDLPASEDVFLSSEGSVKPEGKVEFTEEELDAISQNLEALPSPIKEMATEMIVGETIAPKQLKKLTHLLIYNPDVKKIKSFLERQLKTKIQIGKAAPEAFSADTDYKYERYEKREKAVPKRLILFFLVAALVAGLFMLYYMIFKDRIQANRLYRQGITEIRKGNYQRGDELFVRAETVLGKPDIDWYNRYANEYIFRQQYDFAERKLIGIVRRKPLPESNNRYEVMHVPEKGTGAVFIKPNNKDIRMNIAKLYEAQGNYKKVLENDASYPKLQFDDSLYYLLNRDPKNTKLLNSIALTYIKWAQSQNVNKIESLNYYNKAKDIYLNKVLSKDSKNSDAISGLITIAVNTNGDVKRMYRTVMQADIIKKLDNRALTDLGSYYLEKGNLKVARESAYILNSRKTKYAPAYLFMAKFFKTINDDDRSSEMLVKGRYFNELRYKTYESGQEVVVTRTKDVRLQSKIYNMLGETYLNMLKKFPGNSSIEKENRTKFLKLAQYSFKRAKSYDTQNYAPYLNLGDLYYKGGAELFDRRREGESLDTLAHLELAKREYEAGIGIATNNDEQSQSMPAHIFYNLGYIYYTKDKDYQKSSDYFRRAFISSGRRSSPTIDTAMGLSNLRSNKPDMAAMYFGNVIDYYKDRVARINRDPDPQSRAQNNVLWQLASAYNNLGVAQYRLYKKNNDENHVRRSRESFWKAIEYASKFNSEGENAQARINLRDSILKDNAKYIEHFNIQNRDPIINDYIPYEMRQ